MIDNITNIGTYLKTFSTELAEKIKNEAKPLFSQGMEWDDRISTLLRTPFPAQGDAIMAACKLLEKSSSAIINGEMGIGKSLVGAAIPYICSIRGKPARTLIMCPGHLVKKWQREIIKTIPGAKAQILRSLKDVIEVEKEIKKIPDVPEYLIISKDKAKLSYMWKPAFTTKKTSKGIFCPDCGTVIFDKDGVPILSSELEKQKKYCCKCKSPLWQADNTRLRRFALSDYIKKNFKGLINYAIFDEIHELKGGSTAQGNSFGALASVADKSIALTGTLLGGYSDDIFYVLYRLSPASIKKENIDYKQISKWVSRYGVLEKITRQSTEDNVCSRGKKASTYLKRKPGISPLIFSNHLLDKCIFLHLQDISSELPPITEQVIPITMNRDLKEAYDALEFSLISAVRQELVKGSKSLLGIYLTNLLSYPDRPFNNKPIIHPHTEKLIALPEELSEHSNYPKEAELVKLAKEEIQQGRRMLVFCQYTSTRDVTVRLKSILESYNIKTTILRSSVKPEKREKWLGDAVKDDFKVVIANPKLVETGLDCLQYPTIIYVQTGYSIFTLRQSSRRSWRIGVRHVA